MHVMDHRFTRILKVVQDFLKCTDQVSKGRISKTSLNRVESHRMSLQGLKSDKDFAPIVTKLEQAMDLFKEFAAKFNAGDDIKEVDKLASKCGAIADEIADYINERSW